jgi:hypothetical protein
VNSDDQPFVRSWATARRTVILATPYCWDRSTSLGSRVSGARARSASCAVTLGSGQTDQQGGEKRSMIAK